MAPQGSFTNRYEKIKELLRANPEIDFREIHSDKQDPNTTDFIVWLRVGLYTVSELQFVLDHLIPHEVSSPTYSQDFSRNHNGMKFGHLLFTEAGAGDELNARRLMFVRLYPNDMTAQFCSSRAGYPKEFLEYKILARFTWHKREFAKIQQNTATAR